MKTKTTTTNTEVMSCSYGQIELLCQNGDTICIDAAAFPKNLRTPGCFVTLTTTISLGKIIYEFAPGEKLVCTCPKTCNCVAPPPVNWDGKGGEYNINHTCPAHNERPAPYHSCPIHQIII